MRRYSDEFKLTAVRLSQQAGIQVKTVVAKPKAVGRIRVRGPDDAWVLASALASDAETR